MSKIEIYIPALLKFKDDTISIPPYIQTEINGSIDKPFERINDEEGFNLVLSSQKLLKKINDNNIDELSIKVYYYHHRIVFHYEIELHNDLDKKLSSSTRTIIINHFKDQISELIHQINDAIIDADNIDEALQNKLKIIYYYSYPIIFQKFGVTLNSKLSTRIETMFFRIYLPNRNPLSFGTEAYVRISIPCFHIFHKKALTEEVKSNIINTVFQTVLYKKKNEDREKCIQEVVEQSKKDEPFSTTLLQKYNQVDEKVLSDIWMYSIETMGGKMTDNQQAKVSKVMFAVSFLSFLTAIISIFIAFL